MTLTKTAFKADMKTWGIQLNTLKDARLQATSEKELKEARELTIKQAVITETAIFLGACFGYNAPDVLSYFDHGVMPVNGQWDDKKFANKLKDLLAKACKSAYYKTSLDKLQKKHSASEAEKVYEIQMRTLHLIHDVMGIPFPVHAVMQEVACRRVKAVRNIKQNGHLFVR
jgi:hypothetical protein